ncbi:glycoside hydrolase family 1 protein [Penicillium cosmopolitanum]|uniref:Glycoside hydrolase family 1 protein n=1 Tax=Penicillium cosmopolitanum TaxID=1131564 RepID=A0A9W9SJC1_9EURO|nr:glycoside hydrolase family 1 protein [Penicillium cosmopolitanum]KAJ5379578.1 glycoside hydrolase family 1 protein [Penicillium cosmopolitanum]
MIYLVTSVLTLCMTLGLSTAVLDRGPVTSTIESYEDLAYKYGAPFSYTQETSNFYATALPTGLSLSFAPKFATLESLLPRDVTYTTYNLDPSATQPGRYGQSAFAELWAPIKYRNSTLPFSTTVSPTPVPKSDLVFPLHSIKPVPRLALLSRHVSSLKTLSGELLAVHGRLRGGLMLEGRGPSSLDIIGALPQPETGYANDSVISAMHYLLYKQDIARLAALGVPHFSFSISWTRIVPFGEENSPINELGLRHYEDVIETCLSYGVTPMVTLFHGDAPLNLSFDDPDFPDAFLYYAKQVMTRFAHRVPIWVTLNEPNLLVERAGYGANYNLLKAHAKVYHWYKDSLRGDGKVTVKFANNIAIPQDPTNETHVQAALRYQEFSLGTLANPIFLGKTYPKSVFNTAGTNLTILSEEDLAFFKDTSDFLAIDPYTAQFALPPPNGIEQCARNSSDPNFPMCVVTTELQANNWLSGDASGDYTYLNPQYFRQALGYLWKTFRPSSIAITEFGFNPFMESARDVNNQRYDIERTLYIESFLEEMLKAIHLDGVNVIAAFAWSIMDDNEFGSYEQQYGMQHIDRSSPVLERAYKRSMFDFVDFFHSRIV